MKTSSIIFVMVLMALVLTASARSPPRPKHPQCTHNPRQKCGQTKAKWVWIYDHAKRKCKEQRGCYLVSDKNVFNSKTNCKKVCVY